jgi:hypothetical protein
MRSKETIKVTEEKSGWVERCLIFSFVCQPFVIPLKQLFVAFTLLIKLRTNKTRTTLNFKKFLSVHTLSFVSRLTFFCIFSRWKNL